MTQIDRRKQFTELAAYLSSHAKSQFDKPGTAPPDQPMLAHFALDGVEFEAWHPAPEGAESSDVFHLRCRFGKVPSANAAALYAQALKMNHGLARSHAAMYTLDPRTGDLAFSVFQELDHATPDGLLKGIVELAKMAHAWRQQAPHPTSATASNAKAGAHVAPLEAHTGAQPCAQRQAFLQLLAELPLQVGGAWQAKKAPPEHVDAARTAVEISIGAARYKLVHSIEPSISHLGLIECEFGAPPKERVEASYRRMLEINHHISLRRTSGFSIDPDSGNVVHCAPFPIARVNGWALAQVMDYLAEIALTWNVDPLLATLTCESELPC